MDKDILQHIHNHYPIDQREEIVELLDSIDADYINVGKTQLIRAILTIAKGDIEKIKNILNSNFNGDPRDVIMEAVEKGLNNSGMWPLNN